mmetsp:Transcript_11824/g.28279  ORF Transcript_11824/g.28279 Transcript_11824/m.28279 type:complete len:337 (+) Transcript_11824:607-1617(+)
MSMWEVDHLWSHVLRCSCKCVRLGDHKTRKPHVAELGIAILTQHHIFWLEVTVHNAPVMQVLQGCDYAANIKGRGVASWLIIEENLRMLAHQLVKRPAESCLEKNVHELLVLVCANQSNHERAVNHHEHFSFPAHLAHRVMLLHVALRQTLQRIPFSSLLILHEVDICKAAAPQATHLLQICHLHVLRLSPLTAHTTNFCQLILCGAETVHIGQEGLCSVPKGPVAGESLEKNPNGLALESKTHQALLASVNVDLRNGLFTTSEKRTLAKVAWASKLRNHVCLPLRCIGCRDHAAAREDDVPQCRLPLYALMDDALTRPECKESQGVASQLPALRL